MEGDDGRRYRLGEGLRCQADSGVIVYIYCTGHLQSNESWFACWINYRVITSESYHLRPQVSCARVHVAPGGLSHISFVHFTALLPLTPARQYVSNYNITYADLNVTEELLH